eukprot:7958601-Prorocentrum_lima.AAC.1
MKWFGQRVEVADPHQLSAKSRHIRPCGIVLFCVCSTASAQQVGWHGRLTLPERCGSKLPARRWR